jgi:putative membrane protein
MPRNLLHLTYVRVCDRSFDVCVGLTTLLTGTVVSRLHPAVESEAIDAITFGVSNAQTIAPLTYMRLASAGDTYELQSSELLLQSGVASPAVIAFAKEMLADHTDSTQKLIRTSARLMGMVEAAAPDLQGARDLQELRTLAATAPQLLEAAYIKQQIASHQKALALHGGYGLSGTQPDLVILASSLVPVVQKHLAHIVAIAERSGLAY